jgi:hypothetical protein
MKPKRVGNARLNKYVVPMLIGWAELTFVIDDRLGMEVHPNNGI